METRSRTARIALALAAACALISLGCVSVGVPVQPPPAAFTFISAPLQTKFDEAPFGSKVGSAHAFHIENPFFIQVPIVTWGDASLEAAAASAGIQKLHYADYRLLSVFGIYVQLTVEVYGD